MNIGIQTINYFSVLTDLCESYDNEQSICSCGNNYLQNAGNENRNLHLHDESIFFTNPSTNLHVQTNNIRFLNSSSLGHQNDNDNISHASLLSSVSGDNGCIAIHSRNSLRSNMKIHPFISNSSSISINDCNTNMQSHTSISDSCSVLNNDNCNTLNLGLIGKGIRIGHLNIQGLGSKIDKLN